MKTIIANLQYLKNHGAHARPVRSIFSSTAYPAHTTLILKINDRRHYGQSVVSENNNEA